MHTTPFSSSPSQAAFFQHNQGSLNQPIYSLAASGMFHSLYRVLLHLSIALLVHHRFHAGNVALYEIHQIGSGCIHKKPYTRDTKLQRKAQIFLRSHVDAKRVQPTTSRFAITPMQFVFPPCWTPTEQTRPFSLPLRFPRSALPCSKDAGTLYHAKGGDESIRAKPEQDFDQQTLFAILVFSRCATRVLFSPWHTKQNGIYHKALSLQPTSQSPFLHKNEARNRIQGDRLVSLVVPGPLCDEPFVSPHLGVVHAFASECAYGKIGRQGGTRAIPAFLRGTKNNSNPRIQHARFLPGGNKREGILPSASHPHIRRF